MRHFYDLTKPMLLSDVCATMKICGRNIHAQRVKQFKSAAPFGVSNNTTEAL